MNLESRDQDGLVLAHQELIAIWRGSRRDDGLPSRDSFDPGRLRMHLGCMSMAEIDRDGDVRYRFAGSQLRGLFGGDSRGRRLSSLQADVSQVLGEGMAEAIHNQAPAQGQTEHEGGIHIWLRLPLFCETESRLVLCHDQFLDTSRLQSKSPFSLFGVSNANSSLAA